MTGDEESKGKASKLLDSKESKREEKEVQSSSNECQLASSRNELTGFRGDRSKDKLKICTDPSEIKPLLKGTNAFSSKGCDTSKSFAGSERFSESDVDVGSKSSSDLVTSPTLYEIKTLKSEQYSALFETACEIEYYTSHKNILPPGRIPTSKQSKHKKKDRRKGRSLGDGIVKCHSATSSPIRCTDKDSNKSVSTTRIQKCDESYSDKALSQITGKGEKKSGVREENKNDTDTVGESNKCEVGNSTAKDRLKSPGVSLDTSSTSQVLTNDGEVKDEVWEPSREKEGGYCASNGGQSLPKSSEAKHVIETTC